MHSLKYGSDRYVSLNSPDIRMAMAHIINDVIDSEFKMQDIRCDNKRHMIIVKGKDFYCYDRNFHYPNFKDHVYAVFEFLKSFEDLVNNKKEFFENLE